jgi:hypothetical protein
MNRFMTALERNETLQTGTIATLFAAVVLDLAYLLVFVFA